MNKQVKQTEDIYIYPKLTVDLLKPQLEEFTKKINSQDHPTLFTITDGKSVGTYIEKKFINHLREKYCFAQGNTSSGLDLPCINVDIKTTSSKQPQSSCPFLSARQKIYGLGYNLLIFVYDKTDDITTKTSNLIIQNTIFIDKSKTGDYVITKGLRELVKNGGTIEDVVFFMKDKNLPVDVTEARMIAEDVIRNKPEQGELTISNALQWRLSYSRLLECE